VKYDDASWHYGGRIPGRVAGGVGRGGPPHWMFRRLGLLHGLAGDN